MLGILYNSSSDPVLNWNLVWDQTNTSVTFKFQILAASAGTITVKLNGTTRLTRTLSSSTASSTVYTLHTISKTHASQSISYSIWHSGAQSGHYAVSNPNGTVSISAKASYPVTYNTVGGSSVSNQTKWYDEALTIRPAPTKSGYMFITWVDSNGNTRAPGSSYTSNASLSLTAKYYKYAAFESSGAPIVAYRCNYSTPNVVEDEGTSCVINYTVAYDYAMKTDKDTTVEIRAIAYASNIDEPFYTGPYVTIVQEAPSGSGNINYASGTYLLGDSSTIYDTDSHYDIVLEARTSFDGGSYTSTRYLRLDEAFFTMDIAPGGHCIGFGGPAYNDYGNDPNIKGWILNYFKVAFFDDVMFKFMAGVIQMYGGAATQSVDSSGIVTVTGAPSGWLICDGSAVSRTAYAELFNAISTKWGSGNGSTTFNLPDLRGRAPIGAGTGSGLTARSLGGKIGSEKLQSHYHNMNHRHSMSHTHKLTSDAKQAWLAKAGTGATEPGGSISSSGKYYAAANATGYAWVDTTASSSITETGLPDSTTTSTVGDGNAQNMQPSAVVNFIICTGKTV